MGDASVVEARQTAARKSAPVDPKGPLGAVSRAVPE